MYLATWPNVKISHKSLSPNRNSGQVPFRLPGQNRDKDFERVLGREIKSDPEMGIPVSRA
jgi:hypothetical protein